MTDKLAFYIFLVNIPKVETADRFLAKVDALGNPVIPVRASRIPRMPFME